MDLRPRCGAGRNGGRLCDVPGVLRDGDMDVVGLKHTTQVGLVRLALRRSFPYCRMLAGRRREIPEWSNGCAARADLTSSISTAFIRLLPHPFCSQCGTRDVSFL